MLAGFTNVAKEAVGHQLVSVVVAVYGGDDSEHLTIALASVRDQTYEPVEVLIVVDGPIDNGKAGILEEFVNAHGWRILRLPSNRGPAAARNLGILNATGEYIAIADADDICHRERLKIQKAHLEREMLDVVSSPMLVVDECGTVTGARALPSTSADLRKWAPYGCPLNNPAVFAKASVLKAELYDARYRVSEDYDLWIRLLLAGYKLGNTIEKTVYYRQPPNTITKRRGARYAWTELCVKLRSMSLVPWYERPAVGFFAVCGAVARLLPGRLFTLLYRTKASRHDKAFRADSSPIHEIPADE